MLELLTLCLVVVTGAYAIVTYRILRANQATVAAVREQVEAAVRPYITVGVGFPTGSPVFTLRVRNNGQTTARDLRLTMDRSFIQFGSKNSPRDVSTFGAFQEAIPSFPPGTELSYPLTIAYAFFGPQVDYEMTPRIFKVTATYAFGSSVVTEETTIDLNSFSMTSIPPDPERERHKEHMAALDKIASAVGRLKG